MVENSLGDLENGESTNGMRGRLGVRRIMENLMRLSRQTVSGA